MKKLFGFAATAVVLVTCLAAPAASAASLKIGAPAPDFTLPAAADGKPVALKELLARSKAVAVVFVATQNQDDPESVKSPDLRNALDAVLSGRPVPAAETKAFGCTIKRV